MSDKKLPPPPALPPSFTASSKFCLFHKGDLSEDIYTCPKCKTTYCLECAKKAQTDRKLCIKCKQIVLL